MHDNSRPIARLHGAVPGEALWHLLAGVAQVAGALPPRHPRVLVARQHGPDDGLCGAHAHGNGGLRAVPGAGEAIPCGAVPQGDSAGGLLVVAGLHGGEDGGGWAGLGAVPGCIPGGANVKWGTHGGAFMVARDFCVN